MTERFVKYRSIENSYREKFISLVKDVVPKTETWCVLEKIHGCNMQIYYDEKGFNYGRRLGFIKGSFHNSHNILPKYEERIKKIYDKYKKPIRIFGELFGGKYDGVFSRVKCVQREIEYSEEIDVIFFDMIIGDEMLSYKETCIILDKYQISYLKPLALCSFDEALKYPNDFPSKIGNDLYGLRVLENNICEGVIIKPYENNYETRGGSRIILRNKNKKFEEKRNAKVVRIIELSDKANKLISILESYITKNRFNAVFSKQEYTKKDFGMFLGDFVRDVLEDAKKDEVDFEVKDKEERRIVNKTINKKTVALIKDLFFQKI